MTRYVTVQDLTGEFQDLEDGDVVVVSVGGNDVSRRKCGTREVRCEIVDAGKLHGGRPLLLAGDE